VHVWKPSKTKSKFTHPDDWQLIIYNVLLVLTRGHDLSRSANAISTRKFSLPPFHLVKSFGVTPSNLWKSFYMVAETRVFQVSDGEDLVILACTVLY